MRGNVAPRKSKIKFAGKRRKNRKNIRNINYKIIKIGKRSGAWSVCALSPVFRCNMPDFFVNSQKKVIFFKKILTFKTFRVQSPCFNAV